MNDQDKSKAQLIAELAELRERVEECEQTEEALRESEERYRSFVQRFRGIAYRGRIADFSVEFFHGAVKEITGHTEEDFTSGKVTWDQVICPDDFERIHESVESIRTIPGYATEREYRIRRKDGEIRWLHEITQNIGNESGEPTFVQGVLHDITDRKRAEDALQVAHNELERRVEERTVQLTEMNQRLQRENEERKRAEKDVRESEQRYRSLVETTNDYVWETDQNGVLTHISPQVKDILGYAPEDVVGKTPLDYMCLEEGKEESVEMFGKIVASQKPFFGHESVCLDKDGRRVVVETNGIPIFDAENNYIGIRGLSRDITERKRAEESLREAHGELQAIYDGMVDGVLVADIETNRFVRANVSVCQMLGYPENELLSLSVADVHPSEELSNVLDIFAEQAEGRLDLAENLPVLKKDGSVFYADIAARKIAYKGRHRMIGIFRDVTERKQAQEALEREHRVLRQMLQAQDQERQLVAYDIHDGVAQHLTAAMMQFQSCKSEEACTCHGAGLRMLERSLAEARRLISGLRPPILDESGIVAAIGHLTHDIRAQGGPDVEFYSNVKFDRLEPTLENSIFRVVQESMTNVHQHAKTDRVRIELTQEDDTVRILVEDQGIGFDPESVDERRYGLAGIRERARVLGGSAKIESAPRKGTRIEVELPIAISEVGAKD